MPSGNGAEGVPSPDGFVDFHCHLDLYPDHAAAVNACERAGIFTLAVTTTPRAWPRNEALTASTHHVRAALGIHPQLVTEGANELALWEQYLPQARFVGEVGLDAGPRFYRSLDIQKDVFRRVLQCCAEQGDKVLSVHSVRAAKAVLDAIGAFLPPTKGRIVLHWFTGTIAEARRATELGCYFSINAEMLRTERHRELVAMLPLDRLVTETDGPFTKRDGRPTLPGDVRHTITELAQIRSLNDEEVRFLVNRNVRTLLRY
jgi:TatD DNase family protein